MNFYSTNNKQKSVSFEAALMAGLADDGGLFIPSEIPKMGNDFLKNLDKYSFQEIAFQIAQKFVSTEISESDLYTIVTNSINFPAPLYTLDNDIFLLELFHGPTLAFKDFGARFMAKVMGHFVSKRNKSLNILVATSGDTGSAVANGFYDTPGINVFILYPKGKVSLIQEKQLTTFGKNITALEIDGTFDDCQKLVKTAFIDTELFNRLRLSSANSINIARLLPQSFYYFEAYKQIANKMFPVIFSVPSGNLGNLTAGLIAKKMGLPVSKFIGATNNNRVFTDYLISGQFIPQNSIKTISNAMDVGNPSNLIRIIELYSPAAQKIQEDIYSASFDDNATLRAMKEIYQTYDYVIDPHGAIGYLAMVDYVKKSKISNFSGVVLETAHYSKFKDIIENNLNISIPLPDRLSQLLPKVKNSIPLSANYNEFKEYLLTKH